MKIEELIEEVLNQNASDLHLSVNLPPTIRVDGYLRSLNQYSKLSPTEIKDLTFSILNDIQKEILIRDKEIDFSFSHGDIARFRANAYHQKGCLSLALRLIPVKIRTIDELGVPKICNRFTEYSQGFVLVTGPTGHGKSTTLAAMVDKINEEKGGHIITVEDPIEYNHVNKKAIIAQRELHYDTRSFASALRAILREDPDVVLVGEMRDLETISTTITIAETGHLVFATLHTNNAAQTVDRIIDVFPAHQQQQIRTQLAGILVGIVSQRLIPAIGGGRVVASEILMINSAARNIIREAKTHQLEAVIQTGADQGMQTIDSDLARLVRSGKISMDEARNYALDLHQLERYLMK